eukprot:TRINITY_DN6935_c0_g3_i1.p1 TRINITY_DN6935_c0_g3~~TRINITY_DN6935_c0_g3_i1.p1  ORF type:complete len:1083 (+),score=211.12 TRINITY_DN6935_c0_g3_i1:154-3249(+)
MPPRAVAVVRSPPAVPLRSPPAPPARPRVPAPTHTPPSAPPPVAHAQQLQSRPAAAAAAHRYTIVVKCTHAVLGTDKPATAVLTQSAPARISGATPDPTTGTSTSYAYTVYEMRVTQHTAGAPHQVDNAWPLFRRFRQCHALRDTLAPMLPADKNNLFPPKRVMGNMNSEFLQLRSHQLQVYFNAVTQVDAILRSSCFRDFVNPSINPALGTLVNPLKESFVETLGTMGLKKMGVAVWKRRWAVVSTHSRCLYIFKTRELYSTAIQTLDLTTCVLTDPYQLKDRFYLALRHSSSPGDNNSCRGDTPFPVLRLQTRKELMEWLMAIQSLQPTASPNGPGGCHSEPFVSVVRQVGEEEEVKEAEKRAAGRARPCADKDDEGAYDVAEDEGYGEDDDDGRSRNSTTVPPVLYEARKLLESLPQRKSTVASASLSVNSPVKLLRDALAAENSIGPEDAENYGLYLNGTWMSETASLQEYDISRADKISFAKTKETVLKTMRAAVDPDNVKLMLSNPLTVVASGGYTLTSTLAQHCGPTVSPPTNVVHKQSPAVTPVTAGAAAPVLSLLPGEVQMLCCKVVHVHSDEGLNRPGLPGWMYVTNFRIAFRPLATAVSPQQARSLSKAGSIPLCMREGFDTPLGSVLGMQRAFGLTPALRFCTITLQSKDFHDIRFCYVVRTEMPSPDSLPDVFLENFVFSIPFVKLFAFTPAWVNSLDKRMCDAGWRVYDPVAEFYRMGIPCEEWRLSSLNSNHDLCKSYPEVLAIPHNVSEEDLKRVFAFRSKGRIPALIWRHKNGAAALRCSQPTVGIMGQRCEEDEKFFFKIGACNKNCRTVFIVDARPRLNARANQLKGMGFEDQRNYPNTVIRFLGIDNIHKMREAEMRLRVAYLGENTEVIRKAAASKWLLHVGMIISGSLEIVRLLDAGKSVVMHCSDGWDRTSQLSSVALILLDPYYRTIEGFIVLIEKEWISYGHMMCKRLGHVPTLKKQPERAPIFPQFIDCVFQLMNHLRNAFEFNEYFLLEVPLHDCRANAPHTRS